MENIIGISHGGIGLRPVSFGRCRTSWQSRGWSRRWWWPTCKGQTLSGRDTSAPPGCSTSCSVRGSWKENISLDEVFELCTYLLRPNSEKKSLIKTCNGIPAPEIESSVKVRKSKSPPMMNNTFLPNDVFTPCGEPFQEKLKRCRNHIRGDISDFNTWSHFWESHAANRNLKHLFYRSSWHAVLEYNIIYMWD